MKQADNDFTNWKMQQENISKPFPYIFPQMPSRFRLCCSFTTVLFLLEWSSTILLFLSGLVGFILLFMEKTTSYSLLNESAFSALWVTMFVVSLPLGFICKLLRHTPKFFWRCPCCGQPFPYYAPPLCGLDELKEADCLNFMKHFRIQYVKPKFCPLIVPSVCPTCKRKFFDMANGSPTGDE